MHEKLYKSNKNNCRKEKKKSTYVLIRLIFNIDFSAMLYLITIEMLYFYLSFTYFSRLIRSIFFAVLGVMSRLEINTKYLNTSMKIQHST